MAKSLKQNEIDALLNEMGGEKQGTAEAQVRNRKLTAYDFRRPNLISKNQMNILEKIHDGFCRNASVYLSANLGVIVECNLKSVEQIMYSEFAMSVSPPGCMYVCQVDKPKGQFILDINPQLTFFIVERLLGGKGKLGSTIRPVSAIEQKIVRKVVDWTIEELTGRWKSFAPISCAIERFETNPELIQIVASSDPIVVISIEVKIQGVPQLINICYPQVWLSNLMTDLEMAANEAAGSQSAASDDHAVVAERVEGTTVDVRVIYGSSNISVRDFIELQPGDVIRLNTRVSDTIPVYVSSRHLFDAYMGRSGNRNACKINTVKINGSGDEL